MENNKLSNVWKSQAEQAIKPYTISELDRMIVSGTRKSINKLVPGLKIKIGLTLLISAYLLWQVIAGEIHLPLKIFYILLIVMMTASWAFLWFHLRKMRLQNPAIPVSEWVKEKITEIDKSIAFRRKYSTYISIGTTLFVIGILVVNNFFLIKTTILAAIISISVAVTVTLFLSNINKKRFIEVRNQLQALYDELKEKAS